MSKRLAIKASAWQFSVVGPWKELVYIPNTDKTARPLIERGSSCCDARKGKSKKLSRLRCCFKADPGASSEFYIVQRRKGRRNRVRSTPLWEWGMNLMSGGERVDD